MKMVRNVIIAIRNKVRDFVRKKRNISIQKKLVNRDFTLICDNCTAGVMYHDLGIEFLSPTINLYIVPDDYLKFISNLKYYTSLPVEDSGERGVDGKGEFPIGVIDDIRIYFMHYHSFEEAKTKWEERCKRINWDNLFFIMHKRSDKCQEKHIKKFDSLPLSKKIIFVNTPHPNIKSSVYIKGFEKQNGVGNIMWFKPPKILAKRYYEDFDFIDWLNN